MGATMIEANQLESLGVAGRVLVSDKVKEVLGGMEWEKIDNIPGWFVKWQSIF